ncbi:hypothetical protein [Terrabacter terrigena]|uniref:Excreted virulence factor EspC (Type VII ESX diderm) n=1 Tax=Terrabacter terrigena TaxID=574718 RepID=A0ABW3N1H1_9MICO
MRYEIDTATLRASAATIEEVLAQVRRLGVVDDLRPVGAALPGGRCASGLPQVAAAWQTRLASTQWELRELGRFVSLAADGYDAVEQAARQVLGSTAGSTGGSAAGSTGGGARSGFPGVVRGGADGST